MTVKAKIKQSFAAASVTYDDVAGLQRQVGSRLLKLIGAIDQNLTVLDLGCGTGFLCEELIKQNQPNTRLIALDLAQPMLKQAMTKLNQSNNISYVCADAECLPFQPLSVDLIISNLALQWCIDLPKVFTGINRILKSGGRFCFTTFGPNTLHELKTAWQAVDTYQHVNEFYNQDVILAALKNSGFQSHELSFVTDVMYYPTVRDLMYQLKQLGAQTVINTQKNSLTGKTGMQRMVDHYKKFSRDGLLPATFETITVVALRAE